MRALIAPLMVAALSACGPQWAPLSAPAHPCPGITAAEAEVAIAAGAARATARIHESGMVSMDNGPGVVHCATFNSAQRPCRRPVDFVIAYTTVEGETLHVQVPANEEYRFNVRSRPHTCEILDWP